MARTRKLIASDILISGNGPLMLFEKARQIGFSGIGVSQKGPHHGASEASWRWFATQKQAEEFCMRKIKNGTWSSVPA